jgi:hypothetical protein
MKNPFVTGSFCVRSKFLLPLLTGLICCSGGSVKAATVINASDQGWYDASDASWVNNPNYAAGVYSGVDQRSWFVFDLPTVSAGEGFTAATLILAMPSGGYMSSQPSETYTLYDVTTGANILSLRGTQSGAYADLGSGSVYGQTVVLPSSQGGFVQIDLTAQALADMTAHAGDTFVIGGAATSLVTPNGDESIFGFSSNGGGVSLSYTTGVVPEPGVLALSGCLGLAALVRRKRCA